MTFADVKSIEIPEGSAIRITAGDAVIYDRTVALKYRLHADKSNYVVDGPIAGAAGDVVAPVDYIDGILVWEINEDAFKNNANIRVVILPKTTGYTTVDAFGGCENLETVTFLRTPEDAATTPKRGYNYSTATFRNCPNLKTINVPWAEGAVSGAPWGATNATINYNYTG